MNVKRRLGRITEDSESRGKAYDKILILNSLLRKQTGLHTSTSQAEYDQSSALPASSATKVDPHTVI